MLRLVESIPSGLRDMVAAAFFFSVMSLMAKSLTHVIPTGELVLGRSVVGALIGYGMLRSAGIPVWGVDKRLLIFRGVMGTAALLCFFWTLIRLPLAEATVLYYLSPVFTAIIAALALREPLKWSAVAGLVLSLIGVVFVAQPHFLFGGDWAHAHHLPSVLVGVLGAAFASAAFATVRKLRATDDPLVIVFYFPFVSIFACAPLVVADAVWPTPIQWLLLILVGVTTQIAQIFLTRSLHKERAARSMSVSYVQIVFASVLGALFFGDLPNPLSLVGMILVIAGTLAAARQR